MVKVISSASMSLDVYIAHDDSMIGRLFETVQNGPGDRVTHLRFPVTEQSREGRR